MTNQILITNGPLFDGEKLYQEGSVLIEDGVVKKVYDRPVNIEGAQSIFANKDLIMPGLVDLHSDSLERSIEKRKGVFFDIDFAILNLDRLLVSCGITSFYHAISFADNELGLRSPDQAEKCVRRIKAFNSSPQSLVTHNTHIRYEVGSEISFNIIKHLIENGFVDMVSIMDHTPEQGQFKSMESYIKFHSQEYDLSDHEIIEKAKEKKEKNKAAWDMVKELAEIVKAHNIPLLSHDDDTESKVRLLKNMGVDACEFPVTMEAARQAKSLHMDVFMGSPNLIRNSSTNGNLKASEALKNRVCTGLVSDYYPESLFQASFIAAANALSLENALKKVTSGPGSFLNLGEKPGFLVPGASADIILINRDHEWAHITKTLVKGKTVYQIDKSKSR